MQCPVPIPLSAVATPELIRVRDWVRDSVVGLGLCPFAAPVWRRELLFIATIDADDPARCLTVFAELAHWLLGHDAVDATLLIHLASGAQDFDAYLLLLEQADDLLAALDLDGAVQLASFHPDYCFAGLAPADPANRTNRSPSPLFHLLQEESVSHAVDAHPDPAGIPARNERLMRSLATGSEGS